MAKLNTGKLNDIVTCKFDLHSLDSTVLMTPWINIINMARMMTKEIRPPSRVKSI